MTRSGLIITVLLLSNVHAADAQTVTRPVLTAGGWQAQVIENTGEPARPLSCLISNVAANGALVVVFETTRDKTGAGTELYGFRVRNPAWQIPAGTRGTVTLQAGDANVALALTQTAPNEMSSVLSPSVNHPMNQQWVFTRMSEGNPLVVTLTASPAVTIQPPGQAFLRIQGPCLLAALVDGGADDRRPTQPRAAVANPFEAPLAAHARNPFGPVR